MTRLEYEKAIITELGKLPDSELPKALGLIERLTACKKKNPILGMFADCPEVIDEVMKDVIATRERNVIRANDE